MEQRQLGRSGIHVAPLAFGGNVFGWTADQGMSFRLLDAFVAGGFNLIDTADVYSRWASGHAGGESETIIGNWLKARGGRDRVVIATKLGSDMGDGKKGLSPGYMVRAVEDSLSRLQTDHIDLYRSHRDDPDTPMDQVLETYQRLIQQGKVRAIGASNFTAARLAEAQGPAGGSTCRATRRCSRCTTWPIARRSRTNSPRCACASRSVSFRTIHWRAGS